jgi:pimeloyl-ACP methyl ester carboxylesterase
MGGYIAQYACLRQPQRVLALVSIGSTCIALPYSRLEVWALKATLPLFNLWPYDHFKRTVARNAARTPAVQAYMLDAINQLSREDFLAVWRAVSVAVDTRGRPGHHIAVPLLLTHGDGDSVGTIRRDAPKWAAYEPHARHEVIPDAGHNANQDNPAFFNRLLLDFLRQLPG